MVTKMRDEELGVVDRQDTTKDYIEEQKLNINYLRNHYEDLMKRYPNHWVMIWGGKVISAESNSSRFIGKLSRERARGKIVYYLASPKKRMLL